VIVLHRISVYLAALGIAVSYGLLLFASPLNLPIIPVAILLGVSALLVARLLRFEVKTPAFWVFFVTLFAFVLASLLFFFFLEGPVLKYATAIYVMFFSWLFLENLFIFYYLPASYQAYALEYVSLVLFISGMYFFVSGAFAAQSFLLLPFWLPTLIVFLWTLGSSLAVFWVSKVDFESSYLYALIGALCLAELYMVQSFLPISYMTNAAVFTVIYYVFLGLARAHVINKLNRTVIRRYSSIGVIFLLLLLLTTSWT
jgi:hypothetical protein